MKLKTLLKASIATQICIMVEIEGLWHTYNIDYLGNPQDDSDFGTTHTRTSKTDIPSDLLDKTVRHIYAYKDILEIRL